MAARLEAELAAFVERRLHDGGRRAEELDAIRAALLELAQPGPPLVRRVDGLEHVVDGREVRIGQQAWRDDAVLLRALLLVEHPAEPVHRAHLAHGGDAVRQPELVDVIDGRHPAVGRVIGDAGMGMAVDEAGRDPFAAAVDLVVAWRRPIGGGGEIAGDLLQERDAVAFDHDVGRPDRRRAGAVDHRRATQHETLERPDAPVALGGCHDDGLPRLDACRRKLVARKGVAGRWPIGHGNALRWCRVGVDRTIQINDSCHDISGVISIMATLDAAREACPGAHVSAGKSSSIDADNLEQAGRERRPNHLK